MGVEPELPVAGDVRGDSLLRRLFAATREVTEQVRAALHIGVKRALAVVRSGYSYDLDVVVSGFVVDPELTDEANMERCHELIDAAEVPSGELAKLFEGEVLPPSDGDGDGDE